MTLIAAFCAKDGYVIAADSEESCGTFRRSVQKITPRQVGDAQVIITGSGTGVLIDSFIAHVERLAKERISNPATFRDAIEGELLNFYARDVATYQFEEGEEKEQKLIIAAQWSRVSERDGRDVGACGAWVTNHCTLSPIRTYTLAGHEDVVYEHVAKRIFQDGMSIPQAILAATYVEVIGTKTSSIIREPINIAVIRPQGIWMERDDYVKELSFRLETYEQHLNKVFLACADTSVSVPQLEGSLAEFTRTILSLHREHIERVTNSLTVFDALEAIFGGNTAPAYLKYPTDTGITLFGDGHIEVEHDKTKAEYERARFAKLIEEAEELKARLKLSTSQTSEDQQ